MVVDKNRVRELVNALRSGKYVQANGVLGRFDGLGAKRHCCLGVACEVAISHGLLIKAKQGEPRSDGSGHIFYDEERGYLPDKVRDWFGFTSTNPLLYASDG